MHLDRMKCCYEPTISYLVSVTEVLRHTRELEATSFESKDFLMGNFQAAAGACKVNRQVTERTH
jgi:hypothetical protein